MKTQYLYAGPKLFISFSPYSFKNFGITSFS